MQLTARDRNRLALEADLAGAACTGSRTSPSWRRFTGRGDEPEAEGVFDLDAMGMLRLGARSWPTAGISRAAAMEPAPHFFAGAGVGFPSASSAPSRRPRRAPASSSSSSASCPSDSRRSPPPPAARDCGAPRCCRRSHSCARPAACASRTSSVCGVDVPAATIARVEAAADQVAPASTSRPSSPSTRCRCPAHRGPALISFRSRWRGSPSCAPRLGSPIQEPKGSAHRPSVAI